MEKTLNFVKIIKLTFFPTWSLGVDKEVSGRDASSLFCLLCIGSFETQENNGKIQEIIGIHWHNFNKILKSHKNYIEYHQSFHMGYGTEDFALSFTPYPSWVSFYFCFIYFFILLKLIYLIKNKFDNILFKNIIIIIIIKKLLFFNIMEFH